MPSLCRDTNSMIAPHIKPVRFCARRRKKTRPKTMSCMRTMWGESTTGSWCGLGALLRNAAARAGGRLGGGGSKPPAGTAIGMGCEGGGGDDALPILVSMKDLRQGGRGEGVLTARRRSFYNVDMRCGARLRILLLARRGCKHRGGSDAAAVGRCPAELLPPPLALSLMRGLRS